MDRGTVNFITIAAKRQKLKGSKKCYNYGNSGKDKADALLRNYYNVRFYSQLIDIVAIIYY